MAKTEKKRKKEPRQRTMLKEEEKEGRALLQLTEVLEGLEQEGKLVDIQICPRCKSTKIRKVGTISGDLLGHMGILPLKFECEECGWRARLVLKASNRPLSIEDVAIIAEASDLKDA